MPKIEWKKQLLAFSLASFSILGGLSTTAYAYSEDKVDRDKIETWCQWNYPKLKYERIIPYGDTVGNAACGYFALTSIIRKENSSKQTIEQTLKEIRSKRMVDASWGHFNWNRIEELPYNLKLAKNIPLSNVKHYSGYNYQIYGSYQEQISTLKKLVNLGYYVVPVFYTRDGGAHYIALDYVDKKTGDIRITDSGYKGTWLSDEYTKHNLGIKYVVILEGKNKDPKKSVYNDSSAQEWNKYVKEFQEERVIANLKKTIQKAKENDTKEFKNAITEIEILDNSVVISTSQK